MATHLLNGILSRSGNHSKPRQKISRRISQRDKVVLFDLGVRNAILGLHRRPVSLNQVGPAFEQWLILQVT